MNGREPRVCALAFIVIGSFLLTSGWGQTITSFERKRAQAMLHEIDADVRKHYYDPKFHGLEWDGKVRETLQAIDQADSANQALSKIAALLDSLNDSYTLFVPLQPRPSPRLRLASAVDRRRLLCGSSSPRQRCRGQWCETGRRNTRHQWLRADQEDLRKNCLLL